MNISKDGQTVGQVNDKAHIVSSDAELNWVYDLLSSKGMQVLEQGDKGDLEKYIPIGPSTMGLLAKTLEGFGYEVEMKSIAAGGPGSGRKPGYGKGLNKWKSWDKETKQAQKDPKQRKLPLKSAKEEQVELEGNPIRVPHGTKRIEKVGTLFCVVSDGVDKNFGCYASREQAEAVLNGKSFIEPDIPTGMYASGDMGEPMAGSMGHAHLEPDTWFHPPSLKKPQHIPTDDPGEKDDRFLDVTKRKTAHEDRMKRLKRSSPGGLPPYLPAQTTGLAPHQATFAPNIAGAKLPFKNKKRKGTQGGDMLDIIPRNMSLRNPHTVAYTKGVKANKARGTRRAFNAAHI